MDYKIPIAFHKPFNQIFGPIYKKKLIKQLCFIVPEKTLKSHNCFWFSPDNIFQISQGKSIYFMEVSNNLSNSLFKLTSVVTSDSLSFNS